MEIKKEIGGQQKEEISEPDEILKSIMKLPELESVQYWFSRRDYLEAKLKEALDKLRTKLRKENPDFDIEYRAGFTPAQITEQEASHEVYRIIDEEYERCNESLADFGIAVLKIIEDKNLLPSKQSEFGEVDKKEFQEIISKIEEGRI